MAESPSPSAAFSKHCELCKKNPSKYCCPRCEILYCSLECYKSDAHLTCSEGFYRDCVNEELTANHADEETRLKMVEILKRMTDDIDELDLKLDATDAHDCNVDSDDNEDLELHERIKGIDLNDADSVWEVLTEDERNEFLALVSQGDVTDILQHWEPWWAYRKDAKLVQDIDCREEEEALKKCPALIKVPKFSELTTVQPSPAIRYNIINVLAAYAFVMRYFNGEINPVEAVTYLLTTCKNLDSNANFNDSATAVESVKQNCLETELIETDEISMEVMKRDTASLLQGPSEENSLHYCLSALSHLHEMLSRAKTAAKINDNPKQTAERKPKGGQANSDCGLSTDSNNIKFSKKFPNEQGDYLPKLDVSKLKKCIKKVEFYFSYIESCGMEFE